MPETPAQKYAQYGYGKGNWWYNTTSGEITHATGLQQILNVDGPGLSLAGPFPTDADAQAFKNAFPPKGVGGAVSGAVSAAQTTSHFLGLLASGNLWERVGQVVLGLILIAVGVAKLTGAVPAATKIAKAVA